MVKKADRSDSMVLAELAVNLWSDGSADAMSGDSIAVLEAEFKALTEAADDPQGVCFIKYIGEKPIGFAECRLRRDYVEGTHTSPVGYLEGIYVLEGYRRNGYASELLQACEQWAKEHDCTEFASDCELVNGGSIGFHAASGFDEANRIVCFRKKI